MARVSTLDHWESYWKGHQQDIDDTYSTGGRLVREVLKRGARVRLPLHPSGPAWWSRAWEGLRSRLRGKRWALHTCHVIGTVGRRA